MGSLNDLITSEKKDTNPLIKFLIILMISFFLFLNTELYKIYFIVFLGLAYYNSQSFPYQVSKPRYKMLFIFTLIILAVQVLTVRSGRFYFYLFPEIFNFGPFIPIFEYGLYNGLLLVGRFWGIIIISWVFIDSTNPFDFAHSLTIIRIPYRIAYSLSLSLRFTPIISQELDIIRGAQQTRGLNTNPSTLRGVYNNMQYSLLPLISSTLNRIKDITISMDGRGFGIYNERTRIKEIPLTLIDIIKFLGCYLILLGFNAL
ncbi:MAG: energy-coupling factor transporter transmembrane protein EcfT [Asgard group archaeon]|nr:energy-coupling factor transporter transmembrane protein EcfT [Asgard group archaeon]